MAGCSGKKNGASCDKPVLKCSKCATVGCANKGCSNCNFPAGKCETCGTAIPFSFFSGLSALFGGRAK